jgi:hypothetical protein
MRARGEQLDRVESVRGNVREVVALQPVVVKQVSRDPESVHACWSARSRGGQLTIVAGFAGRS